MVDRRRHRGPHPEDEAFFGESTWPRLRAAVRDLSWLIGRGYATRSALALVGDRWQLERRQRVAVRRCACSDAECSHRLKRSVCGDRIRGATLWIDTFNVLTTVESALGGGILLRSRDGALRDMASMHGSYRIVDETRPALEALAGVLESRGAGSCRWLLDAPVSNSGRLAERVRGLAAERDLSWDIEVVLDVDGILECAPAGVIVASADSRVMDRARWTWQLARETVEAMRPVPPVLDLSPATPD